MKKIVIVICLFALASIIQILHLQGTNSKVLRYDVSGYYLYLPAAFIYHDLTKLDFYPAYNNEYRPSGNTEWYAIFEHPEPGTRHNKYAIGVSILEAPLFFAAHAYTRFRDTGYKADGFSRPYQVSIIISNWLWAIIGLVYTALALKRLFGENIAALTTLIIGLGTNLYAYTTVEIGMSHVASFMLIAMLLYYTIQLYALQRARYIYMLSLLLGLIVLCRPTDIIVALIPLFWSSPSHTAGAYWDERRLLFKKLSAHIIPAAVLFTGLLFLQAGYWKATTGHWIYFSYEGEYFDFLDAEIMKGLFSYGKGWFVYTPVAFMGMIGITVLYKYNSRIAILVFVYFALNIYVIFSWCVWWYGWSFGARPLIDSLPVLALAIAALLYYLRHRSWGLKAVSTLLFGFFIWLNIYQSNQFAHNILPGDGVTKAYYWRIWNKMTASEEDRKLLAK